MNKPTRSLRHRILLSALAVTLLAGAVLWCADGVFSAPDFGLAPVAHDVAKTADTADGRDMHEDRSAADDVAAPSGFYGARVGSRFSWRFHYTTTYRLETRPQEGDQLMASTGQAVALPFRGMLNMQVLDRKGDDITVLAQGKDVVATLPAGADERGVASARALAEAVEAWFLVRIDTRGTVSGYAFRSELTPEQRNFVRALIAGFFHTIPADPSGTWTQDESDPTGVYAADYTLVSAGPDTVDIERVKRVYTKIGQESTVPRHELSGRSRARFDRRSGWLANVKIDESMQLDVVEFPARLHLSVKARFEVASSAWRGVDIAESDWPPFVAASGAGEDLTSGSKANEREQWRAKTADLSLDDLLAALRALIESRETRSPEFYDAWELLHWKLALNPEVVATAEKLLLNRSLDERTGSMLLSALGKAGSEEAQASLLAVYNATGLEAGWRHSATIAMFQLTNPGTEVLQTVTDRLRDLRDIDQLDATSMLLLGTIAPRNNSALPNGRTAMAELIGLEGRVRDLGGTGLWLDALSNTADPSVAPIAAKYLHHRDPLVRESAISALDRSKAKGVASRLIAAAERDPARDVRLRAIEGLGTRESKAGRQTLRNLAQGAKDAAIRRAAMEAIASAKRMSAQDRRVLESVSRRDPVKELRDAARQLLGR